jgi:capsular polysaccharide biosynthesis protein
MRLAAGLYPAAWRTRYGEEFEALLEDIGPRWRDVWNVLGGALKMQMVTWSFWKLVPALGVAGALAAGVAAFTMRPEYESSGVMRVTRLAERPGESADFAMARLVDGLRTKALSRTSVSKIVAEDDLYQVQRGTTMEDAVAQMQRDITIRPMQAFGGRAATFRLAFRYPDRDKALGATHKLMAQIVDANLVAAIESRTTPATVEVIEIASPASPISPNRPVIIGVGLAAGLLLGCLFAVRHWWQVVASAVIGAFLAVGLSMASLSRPAGSRSVLIAIAVLGFVVGLLLGCIAVGLKRRPVLVAWAAGGALLAMAVSVALSFALPVEYQSSAVLRASGHEVPPGVYQAVSRDTLASIIQRHGLYRGEPIDRAIERMQRDIAIQQYGFSAFPAYIVRFTYGDRNRAQRVVTDLVMVIMQENRKRQGAGADLVEVLDPPSLPGMPISPNRRSFAVLGLVAGLLLGPLVLHFRRRTATA